MNETIELAIARLMKIDIFANASSNADITFGPCKLVHVESWQRACDLRGSDEASNAFSEARGLLTRKLSAEHRLAYRQWNALASRNRSLMEVHLFPLVDARIDRIVDLQSIVGGPQFVKDSIRWDFLHFAAEQAFSELVKPGFYTYIIDIYQDGRFPCSWNEVWPDGQIWVL